MAYQGDSNFRHDAGGCLGVLVTNLGTPDAPTASALRKYLAEFLADPRVIEAPRLIWLPILYGIILNIRPRRSAHAYQQIWTEQGSPLLTISRAQRDALQSRLQARCAGPVKVALGMRYGNPSIRSAMEELQNVGARRMLVLPLYPQYCAATTASTMDAVGEVLRDWRWLPELRTITSYHDDATYIQSLSASIQTHWKTHGRNQRLIMSFHGIPKQYLLKGDPYHCQCHKTARLVAESLQLKAEEYMVTFQSRVGPAQWLQPYTDATLAGLPGNGVNSVDVVCPGFSADCLETLEEIAIRGRSSFMQAGGQSFNYIPALNAMPEHIEALAAIVMRHAQGWPETSSWSAQQEKANRELARERALALGADQ